MKNRLIQLILWCCTVALCSPMCQAAHHGGESLCEGLLRIDSLSIDSLLVAGESFSIERIYAKSPEEFANLDRYHPRTTSDPAVIADFVKTLSENSAHSNKAEHDSKHILKLVSFFEWTQGTCPVLFYQGADMRALAVLFHDGGYELIWFSMFEMHIGNAHYEINDNIRNWISSFCGFQTTKD